MNIDLSSTYSLLSSTAEKEEQRLKNVLQKIEKLKLKVKVCYL